MKTTITCDLDPMSADVLKEFLPELLPFLPEMCNKTLSQGCLPQSQRHAIVTPRLKKANADSSDVKNYRPISNLTFMSKDEKTGLSSTCCIFGAWSSTEPAVCL